MTLHIIDDRDPQACGTTLALLAQTLRQCDEPYRLLVLGGSELEHHARALGIDPIQRVGVPLGKALLAPTAVHHAMNHGPTHPPRHRRAPENTDEEIHVWSVNALSAAAVFRPGTPRTLHLTQRPSPAAARRLYKLMLRAGFNARTLSEDIRRCVLGAGLPAGRVYVEPADVHEMLDVSLNPRTERHEQGDTKQIALLSEPAPAASVHDAAVAVTMTREVTHTRLQLVVHPCQVGRVERQNVLDETGHSDLFFQTVAMDTPWSVLPHVDAVMLSDHAGPLSVGLARHSGLPVIAPDIPALREQLDGHENVYWAQDARARNLSHALTTWARQACSSAAVSDIATASA